MRLVFLFLLLGAIFVIYVIARMRRKARLRLTLQQPFPDEWVQILTQNLPPYQRLSHDLREQLHRHIKRFLFEKSFEGCGGLTITDEIRVTIAAQACLLLLNRREDCYPRLRSVLVYPSTYVVGGKGLLADPTAPRSVRLGESWGFGTVVLSWDSVKYGAFNFSDGHNVAMHEFAHQLDQQDGHADGVPVLENRSAYTSWAKVFAKEFLALQEKKNKGKRSVIGKYGAINPAEFFAVATESFFEKPRQLKKKHPELFQELHDYYKVNPIEWV